MNASFPSVRHPYARSHARLLASLAAQGVDARVLAAFAEVPRHWFVSEALAPLAYRDDALPIGAGQTTSRPSTIARMLMLLELSGDERVLEIGAGSGFLTALLCRLARHVYAVERIPDLVRKAEASLRRARCRNVLLRCGDGTEGLPEHAPFDAIVVAAAGAPTPAWLEQLREGGVLVFPMPEGRDGARLVRVRKTASGIAHEVWDACRFVPLVRGST